MSTDFESSIVSSPRCIIAIDPGLSGAVAKIGQGTFQIARDFKVPPQIALDIKNLLSEAPKPNSAIIEAVHAFPGQGVCSVWSFSESTAYAKAALCLCAPPGFKAIEVTPLMWQKAFHKYKDGPEFDSRAICLKLFPSYSHFFKRVKDHNSADAVLIGVWALTTQDSLLAIPLPPS